MLCVDVEGETERTVGEEPSQKEGQCDKEPHHARERERADAEAEKAEKLRRRRTVRGGDVERLSGGESTDWGEGGGKGAERSKARDGEEEQKGRR